jgi:hypothetical protein
VACCPGNITRFLASVPGYVYGQRGDEIFVNLYMASRGEIKLDSGRKVTITQDTRYPWNGVVKLFVAPDQAGPLTVHVRIPGWAREEPVPGALYHYSDESREKVDSSSERQQRVAEGRQRVRCRSSEIGNRVT